MQRECQDIHSNNIIHTFIPRSTDMWSTAAIRPCAVVVSSVSACPDPSCNSCCLHCGLSSGDESEYDNDDGTVSR